MKFEKLNVNTNKRGIWILYGLIMGVVLIIIINYFISMAKYKVTTNAKLVQNTIDYKLPDLTVLGIYVKEGEEYKYVETIPEGSYTINKNLSSCTKKSGEEIKDIIEYREDGLYIGIDERGTRCKVYLDGKATAKDTLAKFPNLSVSEDEDCPVVDQTTGQPNNAISKPITNKDLLCKGIDDDGETYYFRGIGTHNWLKIDNTYWRIVRINGNGSIRLIFSGNGTAATTGTGTMVLTGKSFNSNNDDNAYVGYMYGKPSREATSDEKAYKATHANSTNSNILNQIITWYNGSDIPQTVKDEYIDKDSGFCGDRTPYGKTSGGTPDKNNRGYGSVTTYYGGYVRIITDKKPTLKCSQQDDIYTDISSKKGNHSLPVPVGLITADEVMFAGSGYDSSYSNSTYYLYTGSGASYWTMTPYYFNGSNNYADMFRVSDNGNLYSNRVNSGGGVRPVINLKANVTFEEGGDGSSDNPFVVEL